MRVISEKTWRTIKHSFQTFIIALFICAFAILLTFVEDFAVYSKRPPWLITGIEIFSIVLFIADALLVFAVVARIVLEAMREFLDSVRRD